MVSKIEKITINMDKSFLTEVSNKANKNFTGTINSALRLYDQIMGLQKNGGSIIYRDKDGKDSIYHFIF